MSTAASRARSWSLSFPTLKALSFTHSTIYVCLLVVWLVPGLARGETVFGLAHGVGWICMVALALLALRARVIPLRTTFAVTVLGGIAPFFGSWEFVREGRRRDGPGGHADAASTAAQQAR